MDRPDWRGVLRGALDRLLSVWLLVASCFALLAAVSWLFGNLWPTRPGISNFEIHGRQLVLVAISSLYAAGIAGALRDRSAFSFPGAAVRLFSPAFLLGAASMLIGWAAAKVFLPVGWNESTLLRYTVQYFLVVVHMATMVVLAWMSIASAENQSWRPAPASHWILPALALYPALYLSIQAAAGVLYHAKDPALLRFIEVRTESAFLWALQAFWVALCLELLSRRDPLEEALVGARLRTPDGGRSGAVSAEL
jgi:hypothetical protein